MVFPSLTIENVIQVDDKLRIDASLSFSNNGETITDVLIQPEASESFISVYNTNEDKWYLDWAYELDGTKDVVVRVVGDTNTKDKTYQIDVLSEDDDALFSNDADLYGYEPTIKDDLPKGKNSFKFVHRKAQELILDYLNEQRIWKQDGSRYLKQDVVDATDSEVKNQFKRWSTLQTLLIIFESNQVSVDDIFQEKMLHYTRLMNQSKATSALRLDSNNDGELEIRDIRSTYMVRR